jgi:hypothetical protein
MDRLSPYPENVYEFDNYAGDIGQGRNQRYDPRGRDWTASPRDQESEPLASGCVS